MKRPLILHPILFTAYAVLALLANNITEVDMGALRALVVSLGLIILVLIVLRIIFKDTVKAGLISSAAILLILSYGHVSTITETWKIGDFVLGQASILLPLWGLLFGLWVYWVLKKSDHPNQVSAYFNWVSLILVCFPLLTIGLFFMQTSILKNRGEDYAVQTWSDTGVLEAETVIKPPGEHPRPDIYYIILDGYSRADILEELYDYENSEFITFLETRGFYVAEESRANYTSTELSLSSSFNMIHINTLPEFIRRDAEINEVWLVKDIVSDMIKKNRVGHVLQEQGYIFVTFDTGFDQTEIDDADIHLISPRIEANNRAWNAFELMFVETTFGQILKGLSGEDYVPLQSMFDAHRERINFTLDNLANYTETEEDYFIFAHVIAPHAPYVFGPNGEEIEGTGAYTLVDTSSGYEEAIVRYRDQVHYLNTLVMETIDQILENSDTQPIIILQSDHGGKVFPSSNPSDETRMKAMLPILNAYLLPDIEDEVLYPSITPVNSFRVVFNQYFGADLELMEDTSYILIRNENQAKFIDACEEYSACSP